ncbi:MAG: serine/threonine protein kinase, partial [Mogibacterium sp.]|nr:serine/threonine protein kinase [Mogibacterium sp.]
MNEQTRWHDWEIREKLGSGSYGQVYRIERTSFGFTEQSALKVMRIPQSREDYESVLSESASGEDTACYFKGMVHEIVKEIEIMSQFKGHSNIVSYEDFEVRELEGGCSWEIFIRMELLTPLATWLKTHPILVADVVRIGTDICSALEMCSRKQVIHRDVKPANIFYSAQDTFKIGDFGIARSMESTSTATAKRGTPAYMAPEVYKGERYDATVDLYSLGIVLYQLLNNNRAPFLPPYPDPIRHTDRETSTRKRMSGDPMPLPCNAQNALGEVVLKACAYRPEDRYQSAEELREALQEAV